MVQKNGEVYQPVQQKKMMVMKLETAAHQECCPPLLPFFLESIEPAYAPQEDLLVS